MTLGSLIAMLIWSMPSGPALAQATAWHWPVHPTRVITGFDPPAERWHAGHRGIDLAAAPGSSVRSIGAGTVTFSGQVGGEPVVVVTHGSLRSTYQPVRGSVTVGEPVNGGEVIGILAAGHCQSGCLHLGLKRGATYLDPRVVFSAARLLSGSPARG